MIAYAQNGIAVTEDSILQNVEAPFPQFQGIGGPGDGMSGGGMGGLSQPSSSMNSDPLSGQNSFNGGALSQSTEGSLMSGMDQRPTQSEGNNKQQKSEPDPDSPWFLRPEDVEKYDSFFDHFNKSATPTLTMDEAMGAFKQTQLDESTLESIWALVDTQESGEFDRKMF